MRASVLGLWLAVAALPVSGQLTWADYQRALDTRAKYQNLVTGMTGGFNWIGATDQFWYRTTVEGGARFILVEANTGAKGPAFDHEALAIGLSVATKDKITAVGLPFTTFEFADGRAAISFAAKGVNWRCSLTDYLCKNSGPAAGPGRGGSPPEDVSESPSEEVPDMADGVLWESPQAGRVFGGVRAPEQAGDRVRTSPDGKWDALIVNYNVFVREHGKTESKPLSLDGSEGNSYTAQSIAWSPDSAHLVAYRTRPGYRREVHYIESSPADQLQPKHSTILYAKPGDALDVARPVLFEIASKKQTEIDNALFPNAFNITRSVWRKNGTSFTFEYNQRGHQLYRVIEVSADGGKARAVITEESRAFVDYRPLTGNPRDTGKKVRHDVADGREIVWMSERDGWAHLYLYDGVTGRVKNQITKGEWVVRSVEKVDEEKRQIWFGASGMYAGKDPYFVYYYRINFDGTGLTRLTEAEGNHTVSFSPDMKFYIDEWSAVTDAPVSQLRRTDGNKVVADLEHADATKLKAAGWRAPEVFSAKGRDGKTDIWGLIWWPANMDAAKKYPVVETIYAGPQGSFVPKSFTVAQQPLTELGFIVVQMDGMGTNNRSKAFHDVAFKNLKDAGFEDRILWHRAAAARYSAYDLTRVGVFGTSAGGQNAMGALLFHPEFYKVAVSNSGCHDNRMDKIWWNEQWMGWPIGPQYAESSNVDNANRLEGKLLLVVGEMDNNVDPSSTYQVANALIKANKKFDLLYVPGGGHGAGGMFGQELLFDFFVHHLMGQEPPVWKAVKAVGEGG